MNFLNLYYFRVAAEELSFTNAAKRLFISQQSLSNHISRLENEFGVILFNRTQPITLTEAGKSLYASSKVLLHQKEQIEKSTVTRPSSAICSGDRAKPKTRPGSVRQM